MAKTETSAGFVIFVEDASDSSDRLYLLLDYGSHWEFPKGHLEPGENSLQAALRELSEETGMTGVTVIPGFCHQTTYFFRRRKQLVRKTVTFFLARAADTQVKLSHEHVGFEFLPLEGALHRLTFASARQIMRQADAFLSGLDAVAAATSCPKQ